MKRKFLANKSGIDNHPALPYYGGTYVKNELQMTLVQDTDVIAMFVELFLIKRIILCGTNK
jgi:hypothetical protein